MAKIHEIESYRYCVFSSRTDGTKAVVSVATKDAHVAHLQFRAGPQTLPLAKATGEDRYVLYFLDTDLPAIIDMLRNERPIYLVFDSEVPNNARVSTSAEPVGEGDEACKPLHEGDCTESA